MPETGARSVEDEAIEASEDSENELRQAIQDEKMADSPIVSKPVPKEKKEKLILDEARIKEMVQLFEYDETVLRKIMDQQ